MLRLDFVNNRKVVRSFTEVAEAADLKYKLIEVYNAFDYEADDCLKKFWKDVENVAEAVIDPFMPLTLNVYNKNVLVRKYPIWKNTVK
jgi:hypothetical protein